MQPFNKSPLPLFTHVMQQADWRIKTLRQSAAEQAEQGRQAQRRARASGITAMPTALSEQLLTELPESSQLSQPLFTEPGSTPAKPIC
ncbi:hypothetical protein D3879_08420 [Pseudomonas cavernicola]|uniref:Uncharacterized protein n=1 Tax=Pseudomonas cavernicola TaxID=2320866 RepID=A0A418XLF4_9PSED|nr:hypothetical protein D3879_08420 [Pseudomonas cavernicola]